MYVNIVTCTNFGKIFYSSQLEDKVKDNNLLKERFENIKDFIVNQKLDELENINIDLLHDSKTDRFFGMVSTKQGSIPNHPARICSISSKLEDLKKMANWAITWNEAFSPEAREWTKKIFGLIKDKTPYKQL